MKRFRRWAEQVNLTDAHSATSLGTWAACALLIAAIVAVASFTPGPRAFFGLKPALPLALFALAVPIDLLAAHLVRNGIWPRAASLALWLFSSLLLQASCAALLIRSTPHGAAVLSAGFILTASFQGNFYRVTPADPYLGLGTVLVVIIMAIWAPSGEHLAILMVSGTIAFFGTFVLGIAAFRIERGQKTAERLRDAVQAQILGEEALRAERLSAVVEQFSMLNHDIRNPLLVALLAVGQLRRLGTDGIAPGQAENFGRIIARLDRSLNSLSARLDQARFLTRGELDQPRLEPAELPIAIEPVVSLVAGRFPSVTLETHVDEHLAKVGLRGGALTAQRIAENLLTNACQGDGKRGASRVELRLSQHGDRVILEVRDDGPGFAPETLGAPVVGFQTSKPDGTGLGLYTVERLAFASGGRVERENGSAGGAIVRVVFPAQQHEPLPMPTRAATSGSA